MSGFLAALIAGENKRAPLVLGFQAWRGRPARTIGLHLAPILSLVRRRQLQLNAYELFTTEDTVAGMALVALTQ